MIGLEPLNGTSIKIPTILWDEKFLQEHLWSKKQKFGYCKTHYVTCLFTHQTKTYEMPT